MSVHLNGDEAMALGAAFRAANLSKAFKVRFVGVSDVNPWSIGVRLQGSNEFSKNAVLFPESTMRGSKKLVAFAHDENFLVTLVYEDEDRFPPVRQSHSYVSVTVSRRFARTKWNDMLSGPKVQLAFNWTSRVLSRSRRLMVYEEEIEYEVTEEVEDEDADDEESRRVKVMNPPKMKPRRRKRKLPRRGG